MRQSPTNYLLLAAFTLAEAVLVWHPKELFVCFGQSKDPQTLEVPIDSKFEVSCSASPRVQRTWFQNELSVVMCMTLVVKVQGILIRIDGFLCFRCFCALRTFSASFDQILVG